MFVQEEFSCSLCGRIYRSPSDANECEKTDTRLMSEFDVDRETLQVTQQ